MSECVCVFVCVCVCVCVRGGGVGGGGLEGWVVMMKENSGFLTDGQAYNAIF